jgi:hypothetical protein
MLIPLYFERLLQLDGKSMVGIFHESREREKRVEMGLASWPPPLLPHHPSTAPIISSLLVLVLVRVLVLVLPPHDRSVWWVVRDERSLHLMLSLHL